MFSRSSFVKILLYGLLLWLTSSIAISGLAIWQQYSIAKITNRLYKHPFVANNAARDIRVYSRTAWEYATRIIYHDGLSNKSLAKIREFEDKTEATFELLRETYLGEASDIGEIYGDYGRLKSIYRKSVQMVQLGQVVEAREYLEEHNALDVYYILSDDVNDVISLTHGRAKTYIKDALSHVYSGMWLLVGFTLVLLIIGTLVANTLVDYIRKEFSTIKDFAAKVELGGFDNIPIDNSDRSEFGDLKRTLNTMATGLAQSRDQLVQSEKMASLGSLVAGVSHEINTPVGIGLTGVTHLQEIMSNLEHQYKQGEMSEESFNDFLEYAQELVRSIEINLHKAASLVRSFKQVAVDQGSGERREFGLKEYIEEVLISLRSVTKKSGINITIDIDGNLRLTSYPGAFSQIITNFVMNSLIHAFNPGLVGNIYICAREDGSRLMFSYKDDGEGLREEVRQRIFDPFFTTNREQGGSGLGLNVVHNLVTQRLKGTIVCNSAIGEGTEFVIWVPLNESR